MAGQDIAARPLAWEALEKLSALPARHIRLTVLLCVVAIAGSFAAAGALQLRFEAANAARQAAVFAQKRTADLAAVLETGLRQRAEAGRSFADGTLTALPPGVTGIAISDAAGHIAGAAGEPVAIKGLIAEALDRPVVTAADGGQVIAFRYGQAIVAVRGGAFLPPKALTDTAITGTDGILLSGAALSGQTVKTAVPGWPVEVVALAEDPAAMQAWYASLPLTIFVIFGPAIVGSWLATVFVREFEKRAKAAESIRALRSTRPAEARLLVRLANAERAAVEAARSKAEFVAHMSHEMRTPLNAIIGFAEVVERGLYGPVGHKKYTEYARDIGAAGRSLHMKVADILEFADLEAGRYPLKAIACNITALVETCVADNMGRAFSRRITLSMQPAAQMGALADPAAVRRVVTSLLSNALLYTPEGGKVDVAVREDVAAVAIAITDSGGGFSKAERSSLGKAFRRFERNGISTGTGLGLAIAVALARQMGGALRLQPAPGGGTSAELRLPKE